MFCLFLTQVFLTLTSVCGSVLRLENTSYQTHNEQNAILFHCGFCFGSLTAYILYIMYKGVLVGVLICRWFERVHYFRVRLCYF